MVGDAASLAVPLEAAAGAHREHAEQDHFGERHRVLEVRAGPGSAGDDRVEPLLERSAGDAGERGGGAVALEFLHHRRAEQAGAVGAAAWGVERVARAEHEHPAFRDPGLLGVVLPVARPGRAHPVALVPDERDRRPGAAGGKAEGDAGRAGREDRAHLVHLGLDGRGGAEVEGPEGGVEGVAGPIAEHPAAEVPPAAPADGGDRLVVIAAFGGAAPEVPVERGGGRLRGERERGGAAEVAVVKGGGPAVDLADVADRAGVDPFLHQPDALGGAALVAHLRDHAGALGGGAEGPGLADRVGEGFLDVDVLAVAQREGGGGVMVVVGGGDRDRVDPIGERGEHFPVIAEEADRGQVGAGEAGGGLQFGAALVGLRDEVLVHVAERDQIDPRVLHQFGDRVEAPVADADAGDVEAPVAGLAGAEDGEARERGGGGGGGGTAEESTAGQGGGRGGVGHPGIRTRREEGAIPKAERSALEP